MKHHTEGLSWSQIATDWQLTYPNRNTPTVKCMKNMVRKMEEHQTLQYNHKGRCGWKREVRTLLLIQWVFTIITGDIMKVYTAPLPKTLNDSRVRITNMFNKLDPLMIARAVNNMKERSRKLVAVNGREFEGLNMLYEIQINVWKLHYLTLYIY